MNRHRTLIASIALLAATAALSGCAEMDALRVRTTDQQKQIEALQKENKQFQDAYYQIKSTMDSEVSAASQKNETIRRALEQAKNLRTQKENELANQLNTRQLELDAARNEMTDQKKIDAAKIVQLQNDLQSARDESKAALDKLAASDIQMRKEKERADGLTQQLAKTTVDLKASQDGLLGVQKELTDSRTNLQSAQKQAEQNKGAADAAAKQIESLKRDLETAQAAGKDAEELKRQNQQLEKDLAAQKNQLAQLQAKHAEDLKSARASAAASTATQSAVDPDLAKGAAEFKAALGKLADGAPAKAGQARADAAGLHIVLPSDALFKHNAIVLADDAPAMLEPAIQLLASLPGRAIRVEGHTDSQPVEELPFADNWGLGFARADRVRDYLMTQGGVPAAQLTALSRAQFEPLADNATAEGRARNRRVEIVIGRKLP